MKCRGILFTLIAVLVISTLPAAALQPQQSRSRQAETAGRALQRWLEEDVAYIITDEERAAFKALRTDEEREQFIEQFWLRRDPSPDTIENEARDDHYSLIAKANERYASGIPGWKTDRGRILITWGEPTEIESHPAGGQYQRPFEEGGGSTSTFPFEIWRYRYLEGIGNEVKFEFVDPTMSGEYRITMDPQEKDALAHVPGAGLFDYEIQNGLDKSSRNTPTASGSLGGSFLRGNQFERLELMAKAFRPPEVKFKDLEAIADVTTRLSFNVLPFNFRADFVKVTEESILTPITVLFAYKDLAFREEAGVHTATVNIYARITGINGRLAGQFEDTVIAQEPEALFQSALDRNKSSIYQKVLPLRPGLYKLDLVVKDLQSQNVGVVEQRLSVPRFAEAQLAASSLILADLIEPVPARQVASGAFILGSTKVRPSVKDEFQQSQNLNYWVQVYGLKVDEATKKPSATIETLITRNGREVKKLVEEASELSGAAQQMTVTKSLPLADLEPGEYSIQVKITDNLANALIAKTGKFAVR
jgi:GWxTD domain-containing protein